jgi:protein disulfide-isomerase
MKKLFHTLAACLAVLQVSAAEDWLTDLPAAKAKAKEEKKLVLIDFTGSDWCPPCKALHKNVLATSEFGEYAKKNLVLVDIDFPNAKKQSPELKKANNALKDQFKIEGFPTIVVLDADGKELGRSVGYGGDTVKAFIGKIEGYKKKS